MSKAAAKSSSVQNCVLVLGMHRSGTSALSGGLSMIGGALPKTLAPADHNNQLGYFESKALWDVNDDLLAEIGSGWDDWTLVDLAALPPDLYAAYLARATNGIRAEYSHCEGPILLKDPRMCRMVPLWLEALRDSDCAVHAVLTHRNPQEVVASLTRRDGFEPAFSLLLWLRHVLDAESATRGLPRAFTSYRHLMQDWQKVADGLNTTLALAFDVGAPGVTQKMDAFLSGRLQHFNETVDDTLADPALPQNVRDTFAIMERWAETGEDERDYAALDDIRADLDGLSLAFGPLVRPGQMAILDLAERQADIADAKAQIQDLKAKLDTRTTIRADHRVTSMQADLAEKKAEILRLEEGIRDRERTVEAQARSLDRIRADLVEKQAEMLRLREGTRDLDQALKIQTQSLEEARADNAQLHQNVALAEGDYQALLQSTSWRLTAPLRHVSRRLRGTPKSS